MFLSKYRRILLIIIRRLLTDFIGFAVVIIGHFWGQLRLIWSLCNFMISFEWIFKFTLYGSDIFYFALILVKLRTLNNLWYLMFTYFSLIILNGHIINFIFGKIFRCPLIQIGQLIWLLNGNFVVWIVLLRLHMIKELLW